MFFSQEIKKIGILQWITRFELACRWRSEELIFQDRVTVNGSVCKTPQTKVDPTRDVIYVNGNRLRKKLPSKVYLALNKPKGYICSSGEKETDKRHPGEPKPQLFIVGRLDVATTGASSYALGASSVVSKGLVSDFKIPKGEDPSLEKYQFQWLYTNGLLGVIFSFGLLYTSLKSRTARSWWYGTGWFISFVADYGVPLMVLVWSALSYEVPSKVPSGVSRRLFSPLPWESASLHHWTVIKLLLLGFMTTVDKELEYLKEAVMRSTENKNRDKAEVTFDTIGESIVGSAI
ncbi:hypothetical protein P3L10_030202 [Capsicum annuum]